MRFQPQYCELRRQNLSRSDPPSKSTDTSSAEPHRSNLGTAAPADITRSMRLKMANSKTARAKDPARPPHRASNNRKRLHRPRPREQDQKWKQHSRTLLLPLKRHNRAKRLRHPVSPMPFPRQLALPGKIIPSLQFYRPFRIRTVFLVGRTCWYQVAIILLSTDLVRPEVPRDASPRLEIHKIQGTTLADHEIPETIENHEIREP